MIRFLWRASRGYRLSPWRSPYLRWRIETYWGIPADSLGFRETLAFGWSHRREMLRFLRWAARMDKAARSRAI
jgi:hypothetical protein